MKIEYGEVTMKLQHLEYVIAIAQTSPLNNTLRFSLGFDMGGLKDIFGVNADNGASDNE